MNAGFTGTRNGLSEKQRNALREMIRELQPCYWHHGACLGSDEDGVIEVVAWERRMAQVVQIVAWPGLYARSPGDKSMQSKVALRLSDEVMPDQGHFNRNKRIVHECQLLVACPPAMTELSQGGTWFTIRHARKKGKAIAIIWPDGTVSKERG